MRFITIFQKVLNPKCFDDYKREENVVICQRHDISHDQNGTKFKKARNGQLNAHSQITNVCS